MVKCAIKVGFETMHPFATKDMHVGLMGNEEPSVVVI